MISSQMMSFMSDISTLTIKLLRASSQPVILRCHALSALTKSLKTGGKAIADATIKDLVKHLKNGLGDQANAVQRCSSDALVGVSKYLTGVISTVPEMESINQLAYKALEKADHRTRRPLSTLVAHLLSSTQELVHTRPLQSKGKKITSGSTSATNEDDEDGGSSVPVASALLKPVEMLKLLSTQFNKPNTSRRTRNAIIDVHATLFEILGTTFVETHYSEVVGYLINDLVLSPKSRQTQFEIMSIRELIGLLLRDLIGVRLLSEQGQISAIRELTGTYLSQWPAGSHPGSQKKELSELALVIVLKEVAGLLEQLGNAPPSIQELLQDPLIRLLDHPANAVRYHAAWCLRAYCSTAPLRLSKNLNVVLASLEHDLLAIAEPTAASDLPRRILGKSYGLAAMITVIPQRPLYVSSDITMRVLDMAVSVIKKARDHDVKAAEVEIQSAWSLISALMTLGNAFVKLHLPQLLVLWRNTLPKPTTKDSSIGERGETEWLCLLQMRESALTAILSFLQNNKELATLDVARRLSSLLTNTLNFVNGFANSYSDYLREQQLNPNYVPSPSSIKLADMEAKLRRRTLQCFTCLGASSATEAIQSSLLQAAVGVLADPDSQSINVNQAPTAASSGGFSDVWSTTDGYAFGVTSKRVSKANLKWDALEVAIESQLVRPIMSAHDNDFISLCSISPNPSAPAQTAVIDSGVDLFAALLPHQGVDTLMQSVTLMTNHLRSPKLERNPGRKQAVYYNILVALQSALRQASDGPLRRVRETLGSASVTDVMKTLLQDAILDTEENLRIPAGECVGLLSAIAGGSYLNGQVQWLVDQIVSNRSPEARSGCALTLASVFHQIGGINATPLLRSITSVLSSLSVDPHPLVHFSALRSLSQIIDAAGLAFDPYVDSTCRMLLTIYLAETHEPDGGSVGSSNMRGDLPAYQVMCRSLDATIAVVGPELPERKDRPLLLVKEFRHERDEGVAVETMGCIQQFLMFAPAAMDLPTLVSTFRAHLSSKRRPLRVAAITALYQIVQKDAPLMSKLGGNQLVEDLFALLDEDPTMEGVREVILAWVRQTCDTAPSGWIGLCQRIISRSSTAAKTAQGSAGGLQDDESQSLGAGISALTSVVSARWRTQLFALQCVHEIIAAVRKAGRPEQFDLLLARRSGLNEGLLLVSRLADLIRLAFAASTASTSQVRLQGLVVLRDVVEAFSHSMDPDFESLPLLEQYQAPIAAALTPSFGPDSAPEVVASAIKVCAAFIGSGVVKDVSKMGRIVKLLTGALLRCEGKQSASLGEVEDLSSNASIMLKISTLSAWAELKIACSTQEYLRAVVRPHEASLTSLWVSSLRDYALLRADNDNDTGSGPDVAQSGLAKEVLLPYYEDAAFMLLHAMAKAMKDDSDIAIKAVSGGTPPQQGIVPTAPLTHFFVLYGLAFEIVTNAIGDLNMASKSAIALSAMQSLVRVEYCGIGMFTTPIFEELTTMCYRIAMAEPARVRSEMVKVMQEFAQSRALSGPAEHIRRTLAVVTFALRSAIGSREIPSNLHPVDSFEDRVTFISNGFQAFYSIVRSSGSPDSFELLLSAIQLYLDLLKDETTSASLGGPCLPSLKVILDYTYERAPDTPTYAKLIHNLLSAALMNMDEMRGREGVVADTKLKNNMLTVVLVLNGLSPTIPLSRELLGQICYTIGQRTRDESDTGSIALQCTRALLLAALKTTSPPALQMVIPQLITELVRYISKVAEVADKIKPTDYLYLGLLEVLRSFVLFVSSLEEKKSECFRLPPNSLAESLTVNQLFQNLRYTPFCFQPSSCFSNLTTDIRSTKSQSINFSSSPPSLPSHSKRPQ